MRTERRGPDWYWLVIAGVFASSCRFVEEPDVHDRGVIADTARPVRRDHAEQRRDRENPVLVPVLECVETSDRGKLRAHFGYENGYRDELYVPIGEQNRFRPWPKDRDQPIYFKAGRHERVVSVAFADSDSVTWVLEDGEAVADSDSPRCKDRDASGSDSKPGDKGCGDPKRCPTEPKPKDAGAPSGPMKPVCPLCDAGCPSPEDHDKRDAAPPHVHDAGCGCGDDAGAAPRDAGTDAAVGDKQCPKSAQFGASCVGALHCGPYDGPLHAKCTVSCCDQVDSYTVPLPTIAECIDDRWAFSVDPEASTDACGEPRSCSCTADYE